MTTQRVSAPACIISKKMLDKKKELKLPKQSLTILRAGGNELANQLWNYASIYAYTLEQNLDLKNPSFFEYGSNFNIPTAPRDISQIIFKAFFFWPFDNYRGRKTAIRRRLWRKMYALYVHTILLTKKSRVFSYEHPENIPFYLAPTPSKETLHTHCTYLDGWLFRNPVGLEKYREKIRAYFAPKATIQKTIADFLDPIKQTYPNRIGVHIRQGDYRTWRNGAYFIEQKRIHEILEEYLETQKLLAAQTCFIIASDGPINPAIFAGLNIVVSKNGPVEDLFMLSQTDAVIGSNSTFGDFAAYYGNIPHIIATNEPIDWEYYAGKKTFFPNKYCTWVHY